MRLRSKRGWGSYMMLPPYHPVYSLQLHRKKNHGACALALHELDFFLYFSLENSILSCVTVDLNIFAVPKKNAIFTILKKSLSSVSELHAHSITVHT